MIGGRPVLERVSYSWFNQPVVGDHIWVNLNEGQLPLEASKQQNAFQWQGQPRVQDQAGVSGQNADNPVSIFGDHVLVTIGGGTTLYDPSYGKKYNSLDEFETAAIAGYLLEITLSERQAGVDLNQNGTPNENIPVRVFLFRANGAGNDLL